MRKLSADFLFTLDRAPIEQGVVILDDQGYILDVLSSREGTADIEVVQGVLCPGFINAHGHLELSHLQGKLEKRTGLVNFILAILALRNSEPERILPALQEAEHELYKQGVVGMGDISNSADSFGMKSGGKLRYHTFLECLGFMPERAAQVVENAKLLKAEAPGSCSLSPHAPYTVSEELFRSISASETGILSIHNQESLAENEFYKDGSGDFARLYHTLGMDTGFFRGFGTNSLPAYSAWLGDQKKLLVHNTFTTALDLEALNGGAGYALCLCPGANLYIEGTLPDIPLLISSGWPLLLGTDSLASNDQLSMLSEMYLVQQAYPGISLETMLGWACRNGAEFFNWSEFGTLAKGKRPGIVHLTGLDREFRLSAESRSYRFA